MAVRTMKPAMKTVRWPQCQTLSTSLVMRIFLKIVHVILKSLQTANTFCQCRWLQTLWLKTRLHPPSKKERLTSMVTLKPTRSRDLPSSSNRISNLRPCLRTRSNYGATEILHNTRTTGEWASLAQPWNLSQSRKLISASSATKWTTFPKLRASKSSSCSNSMWPNVRIWWLTHQSSRCFGSSIWWSKTIRSRELESSILQKWLWAISPSVWSAKLSRTMKDLPS